jgi:hypothetical protein
MQSTVNGSDTRHNSAKQFTTLFFVIMSKSVALSLLAQGNTAAEILSILDTIVADIEQENIDDVAAYFAAL